MSGNNSRKARGSPRGSNNIPLSLSGCLGPVVLFAWDVLTSSCDHGPESV